MATDGGAAKKKAPTTKKAPGKKAKKAGSKKKSKTAPKRTIRKMARRGRKSDTGAASNARLILTYAHDSAISFEEAFRTVRAARGAKTGTSTDEEQDLVRAMLVFAAAGLDSTIKQLIRDALPELSGIDDQVAERLEAFVSKQVRVESDGARGAGKFLARVLTADDPRRQVIEAYILELTGSSLQSADELMKACNALGLEPKKVKVDKKALTPIFRIRNEIIHELDINFDHVNRNRESRSLKLMSRHSNQLLEVGEAIVAAVEAKLKEAE